MTLSRIAQLAHVSLSTVSKAFSGSSEVNEQTRRMIFDIAQQHGCFQKFYNAKYPKYVIAVLCPEFSSLHYMMYLDAIQKQLEQHNCEICMASTNFSAEKEQELLEYYYKYSRVDGIIGINLLADPAPQMEIPVILVAAHNPSASAVLLDSQSALEKAVTHLVHSRVNSIGFIGESLTTQKAQLVQQVLNRHGLSLAESLAVTTDRRFEDGGYSAMEELFKRGTLPRALICAYDYMAIGAIRCILDHGLHIPDDIAVLGMDDIPEARYLNPPLASIAYPVQQAGETAASMMLRQLHSHQSQPAQTIPCVFHLRDSFVFRDNPSVWEV